MKLSNLKIGTRLYFGFGAIGALLAILVAVAYVNFSKLGTANDWNVHTYEVMGQADGVLTSLINMETGERGFLLTGNEASLEPFHAGKETFEKYLAKAKELTSDNKGQQERWNKIAATEQQWLAVAVNPVLEMRRKVVTGGDTMANVLAFEQAGKGKTMMDGMRAVLAEAKGEESRLLGIRAAEAEALKIRTSTTLVLGSAITLALAGIIAFWMTGSIVRPLNQAVKVAQTVAEGDLTSSIVPDGKDEAAQLMAALATMNANLLKIVSQVRDGTDSIATGSSQIASGNSDLSERTEKQASALEETASSMEELTSTMKQNAGHARQANELAVTASNIAVEGGQVVGEVVQTMSSINDSSKKIVDIISVIDGIAFQTNILALNAAVEAARAGEQGRGFAVVASEVRTLAQRSSAAAKEIKALIDNSVDKVDLGTKLVEQAGATMTKVVSSIKSVADMVNEISHASKEQSEGIEQVNQAITQMDQVTQQNASLVEESAAATKTLQDQASNLAKIVSAFQVNRHSLSA